MSVINMYTKKKNCNKCIAYKTVPSSGPVKEKCPLGYSIKHIGTEEPFRSYAVPQENCPKPLTNSKYLECLKWYRKGR